MTTEGTRPPYGRGDADVTGRLHVKASDDTDFYAWTPGMRLRVDEVSPPPDDWPSMLYAVDLRLEDEPGTSVRLWCQIATRGAPLLHKGDVVTVTGQTPGRVFVERFAQGDAERARYVLVDPNYERDFDAWAQQQAEALRAKRWEHLDVEHLAEEVEELRKTERRGVHSQLRLILSHLLKWRYQPDKRSESWRGTIANGRVLVQEALEDVPSLARELPTLYTSAYPRAWRDAAKETGLPQATFPEACPWTVEQVLDEDFWPEA
jgi:hypothetical protein